MVGPISNTPYLKLDNEIIWLDHPRRDFSIAFPGSGGYFCSGLDYEFEKSGVIPVHEIPKTHVMTDRVLGRTRAFPLLGQAWGNQPERIVSDPVIWTSQPVLQCPRSTPWILNTTYVSLEGKLFKLRWGPNYVDTREGEYADITLGDEVIWTTHPYMRNMIHHRERDAQAYVIENQSMELHSVVRENLPNPSTIRSNFRKRNRDLFNWWGLYRGAPETKQVELLTERNEPLYSAMIRAQGLCTSGHEGPLLDREELHTTWQWSWRGLDPRITLHPSPLYQQLLNGRIRKSRTGHRVCEEPQIVEILPPKRRRTEENSPQ